MSVKVLKFNFFQLFFIRVLPNVSINKLNLSMLTDEITNNWSLKTNVDGRWSDTTNWASKADETDQSSIADNWAARVSIAAVSASRHSGAEHRRSNSAPNRVALGLVKHRLRDLLEVDWNHVILVQTPTSHSDVRSSNTNTAASISAVGWKCDGSDVKTG